MSGSEMKCTVTWELTSYFPEFDGSEMREFKAQLERDIATLHKQAAQLAELSVKNQEQWEDVVVRSEEIITRFTHLASYVGCLSAGDAHREDYQREEAAISLMGAALSKMTIELLRAVKSADDEVFETFRFREKLNTAAYALARLKEEAQRTMTPEKEVLAADLRVDGMGAWGRLYDKLSGKLEFEMVYPDGRREATPMAVRRNLLDDPDRQVRAAAFTGGNEAWRKMEDVAAAALNHIAGARLTLNRHRGVDHFLDIALFQSAISRETLDAMFEAIYANLELSRDILRIKANILKLKALSWFDLGAPLPLAKQERFSWEQGRETVANAFAASHPPLAEYFEEACRNRWIEAEPRKGKRPGAFCTSSLLSGESRVFMTYQGQANDLLTLAHEIGHAFHNHQMRDLRPFAREYPMTLAESASTFAELLLTDGVISSPGASDAQKAAMLDIDLSHGAIFLLDIPVRYEFEKALYEERQQGELPVSRLKELMVETQRRVFGDALEEGGEDAYFWASKLHFYITGVTFYNFPYTFGYLLSRGLYAMFKKEGADFLPRYREFLRLTGSDTAENVAARSIGRDLSTPEFWNEAIQSLEQPRQQLAELLPRVL